RVHPSKPECNHGRWFRILASGNESDLPAGGRAPAPPAQEHRKRRFALKIGMWRAVAVAAVVALTTGVSAASTSSVTITSPRAGQSISLKKNPYLAVAGGVSFAPATAGNTTFYLRRDGCGTSNDNPHLSV